MYEFHSRIKDSSTTPGQTFNLDYSLLQVLPLTKKHETLLQFGVVGYGQWQTTDHGLTGTPPPGDLISNSQGAHYGVNAVGFTANIISLQKKVNLGVKYFWEYGAKNTGEGSSLQITGAITF
jgi:hypothetical protein